MKRDLLEYSVLLPNANVVQGATVVPGTFDVTRQSVGQISLGLPSRLGDGRYQFQLRGARGLQVMVQFSEDLRVWNDLASMNVTSDDFPFIDPSSTPQGKRFYRVKL